MTETTNLGGESTPEGSSLYIASYDPDGALRWASAYPTDQAESPLGVLESVYGLALDEDGGACASGLVGREFLLPEGLTVGGDGPTTAFAACWSEVGELRWVAPSDPAAGLRFPRAVGVIGARAYVTGSAGSPDRSEQGWFLRAFETESGAADPEELLLAGADDRVTPQTILGTETGNVLVAGSWRGTLDYGEGTIRAEEPTGFVLSIPAETTEARQTFRIGDSVRPLALSPTGDLFAVSYLHPPDHGAVVSCVGRGPTGWSTTLRAVGDSTLAFRAAAWRNGSLIMIGVLRGRVEVPGLEEVRSISSADGEPSWDVVALELDAETGRPIRVQTWGAEGNERLNESGSVITQTSLTGTEGGLRFLMRVEGIVELGDVSVGAIGRATWVLVELDL